VKSGMIVTFSAENQIPWEKLPTEEGEENTSASIPTTLPYQRSNRRIYTRTCVLRHDGATWCLARQAQNRLDCSKRNQNNCLEQGLTNAKVNGQTIAHMALI